MTLDAQFNECGFIILRDFFNNEEITQIATHVDRIYETWVKKNEQAIYDYRLVNMHSLTSPKYFNDAPHQRVKFFSAIAPFKLTSVLANIFGEGLYFHNTQLFFNPSNNQRLTYWHRDMQFSDIEDNAQRDEQHSILNLHVRIPLVDEKGLELVPGSHKRWDTEQERNVRFELGGRKNSDDLPDSLMMNLARGDVLIFDGQMLHRGVYKHNPIRKAFDVCVGKYHSISSCFLDPQVLPTEEEMAHINNSGWYTLAREVSAKIVKK